VSDVQKIGRHPKKIRIGEAVADGENQTVRESFGTFPLVNLHLERMFSVKNE